MSELIQGFSIKDLSNALAPDQFHLILYPTEACNFRCVYCYEDFALGNMPDWLVTAVKSMLSNKMPTLKRLSLAWFGGEPLLAKKIVYDVSQHAFDLAQKYGINFGGNLTTNASLLDRQTLSRLSALKQNIFQISIDGDQEMHDTTRVTKGGKGSFDQIYKNLLIASESDFDFKIILRIHITDLNQSSVQSFCDRYDQTMGKDPRFQLFFKAVGNYGGGSQDAIKALTGQKSAGSFIKSLRERYKQDAQPDSGNKICYAARPNSLAIRADGRLNKCTVSLADDYNHIGRINRDGSLNVDGQKFATWHQGFLALDSQLLGCPMRHLDGLSRQDQKKVIELKRA